MLRPDTGGAAPHGRKIRHLRYFVAVADIGIFTQAAERMFIARRGDPAWLEAMT
jgi:hypothetical protein